MLKRLTKKDERGFTLIELMIVIAIIGILAAIAIPQFAAYRNRAYNSAAQADLKNLMTAQEAYFVERGTYCSDADASPLLATSYGWSQTVSVTVGGGAAIDGYTFTSRHGSGTATYSVAGPGGTVEKM